MRERGGPQGHPRLPPSCQLGLNPWEPLTSTIYIYTHTISPYIYMHTRPPYMCVYIICMYNLSPFLVSGGSSLLIQLKFLPEMTPLQIFRFLKKLIQVLSNLLRKRLGAFLTSSHRYSQFPSFALRGKWEKKRNIFLINIDRRTRNIPGIIFVP